MTAMVRAVSRRASDSAWASASVLAPGSAGGVGDMEHGRRDILHQQAAAAFEDSSDVESELPNQLRDHRKLRSDLGLEQVHGGPGLLVSLDGLLQLDGQLAALEVERRQ